MGELYALKKQIEDNFYYILFIFLLSSLLIGSVLVAHFYFNEPIRLLTRDPLAIAKLPYFTGYFSQLGAVIWIATVTIALFTSMVTENKLGSFLLFSGLFSLLMAFDDIFMLHEGFLPSIGLSENVFYAIYAVLLPVYIFGNLKSIRGTPYIFLFLIFGSFGLSALNDIIKIPGVHPYIYEDGFKMIGIICWMTYHYNISVKILRTNAHSATVSTSTVTISGDRLVKNEEPDHTELRRY